MSKFKVGDRVRIVKGTCLLGPVGAIREVISINEIGRPCVLPGNDIKTPMSYGDEYFEGIEPTDQELADKWQAMSLEARETRRELEKRGFSLQAKASGVYGSWVTQASCGHEGTVSYRFRKEEVVKSETIL